jgi:O-antigen/teichoic acid export membrane protein
MTPCATPPTAGLRDQLAGLARGNLAALLAGQSVLALVNMAILFMVNRVYARPGDTADAGRLAVVSSITLAAVLLTAGGVAASVTRRIARARAAGDEGKSDAIGQSVGLVQLLREGTMSVVC